ncbi:MAG: hypothetical protein IT434_10490 [Phycisphaerales bacterium]|nr:hypothetical protein [Phycisphaerales bacterium]
MKTQRNYAPATDGSHRTILAWVIRCILLLCGLGSIAYGQAAQAPQAGQPMAIPASRQARNLAVITVKGPISALTFKSIERRLQLARRAGADAVVIELDTPGGELGAALDITSLLKRSDTPIPNTVAWVHPNAFSAGSVIALACREIVVSEGVNFGDALVIATNRDGSLKNLKEAERQKLTAPLLSDVVDSARLRGYDEYLVQGFVTLGVALWQVENIQTGQRLFVNAKEYKLLFGQPPADTRPRVPSAPPGETARKVFSGREEKAAKTGASKDGTTADGKPANDAVTPAESQPTPDQPSPDGVPNPNPISGEKKDDQHAKNVGEAQTAPPPQHQLIDPATAVKPASPAVANVAVDASATQSLAPQRPEFSLADQGKYRLVEYVADGNGPLILKTGDMERYGLARQVVRNDAELLAFFGAKNLRRLDPTWSEGLVAFLTNPIVRGVLIVIFLIALFLEMSHPGVTLPGLVAGVSLVALLAPPLIIGMANWWEVAAIASGILLIALEIFVIPGFGITGILGVLLLFAGLIGTFVPSGSDSLFPDSPQGRSELLYGVATVALAVATSMVGCYFLAKHFGSLPIIGKLVLKGAPASEVDESLFAAIAPGSGDVRVGQVGTAITPLRPSGKMQAGDKIIDVVAQMGFIAPGAKVRVVVVTEFRIEVEAVEGNA